MAKIRNIYIGYNLLRDDNLDQTSNVLKKRPNIHDKCRIKRGERVVRSSRLEYFFIPTHW
uniref:Uncharacterized protein n=1 Tax=Lepeophtheirus salmonis TaxID=72036 RepID=A0A0K2TMI4_LEPSM